MKAKATAKIVAVLLLTVVLLISACGIRSEKTKVNEYAQSDMIIFFENMGYLSGVMGQVYTDEMGISDQLNFAVTVSQKDGNHHAFIYSFKTEDYAQAFYARIFSKNKKLSGNFVVTNIDLPEINDYFI